MAFSKAQTNNYLPGNGGQLATGLGRTLMDRGFDVTGRETGGDFRRLPTELFTPGDQAIAVCEFDQFVPANFGDLDASTLGAFRAIYKKGSRVKWPHP